MKDGEFRLVGADSFHQCREKIHGQQPFEDGQPRQSALQVAGALPQRVAHRTNIELGRPHERGLFPEVALQDGYGVVQRQPHAQGQKQREQQHELQYAFEVRSFQKLGLYVAHVIHGDDTQPAGEKEGVPLRFDAQRIDGKKHGHAEYAGNEDEDEDGAGQQVARGVQLLCQRELGAPHARQHFFGRLGAALHPAVLLRFEAVHFGRQLGRCAYFFEIVDFPAAQLSADAEVEVFGEGVGLPPAGIFYGASAPHTCRAIELQQKVAKAAPRLLHAEVDVELQGLQAGDETVVFIEVFPSGLHHADPGVVEVGDGAFQKVGPRQKIGVEDGDELAPGQAQPVIQCAGFEAFARAAPDVVDLQALPAVGFHLSRHDVYRFIGRVVEYLDLQAVARIVQCGHVVDEALGHEQLVVDGQLYGHHRPFAGRRRHHPGYLLLFSVLPQQVQLHQAKKRDVHQRQGIDTDGQVVKQVDQRHGNGCDYSGFGGVLE